MRSLSHRIRISQAVRHPKVTLAMPKFESVAVPFTTLADGTRVLTDLDIVREPYLMDFIKQFKHCFEHSNLSCHWVFLESDEQKQANLRQLQSVLQGDGGTGGQG